MLKVSGRGSLWLKLYVHKQKQLHSNKLTEKSSFYIENLFHLQGNAFKQKFYMKCLWLCLHDPNIWVKNKIK